MYVCLFSVGVWCARAQTDQTTTLCVQEVEIYLERWEVLGALVDVGGKERIFLLPTNINIAKHTSNILYKHPWIASAWLVSVVVWSVCVRARTPHTHTDHHHLLLDLNSLFKYK